jgi:glucose-1-phosphate thymidylyltransferase
VKAVILAAGYATRLYPLTRDAPKHLLEVGGRPILDRLLEQLPLDELDAVYVVTNSKFADRFRAWAEGAPVSVEVLDDGTTSEDDKLGAIGDLALAIERKAIDDDLLVAAGDSVFSERLDGIVHLGREREAAVIAAFDVGEPEEIRRLSALGVDADGRIVSFEEKPENPTSTLAGIALYYYPRSVLPLVGEYLAEGNNPDQPGRLVGWLYTRVPVYAWRLPGLWLDIGTQDALAEAEQALAN